MAWSARGIAAPWECRSLRRRGKASKAHPLDHPFPSYYLRTLGASNIEKATIKSKKEVRGLAGEDIKKEFSEEEKKACSIEAMMNGEECEACQ